MKPSKLQFILAFLFAASPLLAQEDPCQNMKNHAYQRSTSITPHFTIQGNILKTLGFSFELKKSSAWLKIVDPETPFHVLLYKSPDRKMGVLSLGSGQTRDPERDLWLIDFEHQKTDLLDQTGGSFTDILWHSNELFEIRWGGNGYNISVFVQLGKTRQEQRIDYPLDVDFNRGIYVAYLPVQDLLEIGRLFKKDVPTEKFHIPPVGVSYTDWLQNVEIKGNEVVVCFDDIESGEKVERLVFHPEILK